MPRQQTLSYAAYSVWVREKEDVGLSAWCDVTFSVLKPVCVSFSCVCMNKPVRQSVLVSV